ncbi:MAG: carboxypeptidase regulatory-like domain-containing protein [Acidobacteriota bacterium]
MAAAGAAFGQAATGTLTGTVLDESQAIIPGADVVLINEGTRDTRRTVTNDEGFFAITAIPAGTYIVEIMMPGFATWRRTNVIFRIGDKVSIREVTLAVAATAEEVTVSAAQDTIAPMDSGEKSAVITSKEIQNLSIVGRSAVELLKILPGVVYTGEGFPGETVQFNQGLGQYNVAGTRNTQVALLSDGADVIDPGCECGAAVTPNVDLVSEVKVQTASFGAENAKGPVVLSSVSKAGTSEFHGAGYVYFRQDAFNSQDWRANRFGTSKPEESYYFPGFNIGGPLTPDREKVFFFAGFEYMGQNFTQGDIPAVVPTAAMRQGDFSQICTGGYSVKGYNGCPTSTFWGNWTDPGFEGISENGIIDPSLFDPGGRALINLYPLPNRDPALNDGWNYVSNVVRSQNRDQELVRVDWNISDNTKLYTRFNHEFQGTNYPYTLWWTNDQEVPYPSNLNGDYHTWSSSTSLANVLSPTTTNEVVVALTYWKMPHELEDPDKVSRSALGYPYEGLFNNGVDMVPSLTGWSSGLATLHQSGGLINPTIFGNKWLVSAEDNFSKVIDTHTIKMGGRWGMTTNDEPTTNYDIGLFAFSSWGDNATGNAYSDLLLGRASDYVESTTNVTGKLRRHEWAWYIQDSWKTTRRLTLELGTRFLHNGFNYDLEGRLAGFDPRTYDPNAPLDAYSGLVAHYLGHDVPKSVWKTPALLVSPRFGFAYDLTGNGQTVLRGGAGMYHYHGRGADSLGAVNNPPLAQNVYLCCGFDLGHPDTQEPSLQKSSISVLEPNSDAYPQTISFSLTVSQRLPANIFWETSYVGNTSSHQLTSNNSGNIRQINVIAEGTMPLGSDNEADFRPFHSFNDIFMKRHMLSQNYHSLQVMLNRQTGAFNFAGSYTFSKAMGIGGDSFGVNVDAFDIRNRSYGPLGYDRTHSFSLAYNYLIPNATDLPIWREILNGWQLTGITQFQSGAPIRRLGMAGMTSDGISANDQIDITGSPDTTAQPVLICDPREGTQEGEWFNPRCFEAPTIGNNGHYALPYFKGPGFQNHDVSIFKNWQIGNQEDRKLQFRASFYNVINHPIPFFSGQELRLNFTEGALLPETIETNNIGRTALKRGRRIMQFAIKYMF